MKRNHFCADCALYATCTRRYDERLIAECPILKEEEEPLRYRNSEGYPDPTAFFAMRNVLREQRRKEAKQRQLRTMVVHYD